MLFYTIFLFLTVNSLSINCNDIYQRLENHEKIIPFDLNEQLEYFCVNEVMQSKDLTLSEEYFNADNSSNKIYLVEGLRCLQTGQATNYGDDVIIMEVSAQDIRGRVMFEGIEYTFINQEVEMEDTEEKKNMEITIEDLKDEYKRHEINRKEFQEEFELLNKLHEREEQYLKDMKKIRRNLGNTRKHEIKIYVHVDVDFDLFSTFKSTLHAAQYVMFLFKKVSLQYYQPNGMHLLVSGINFRTKPLTTTGDSLVVLYKYQSQLADHNHAHIQFHLTKRNTGGGIAWIGGVASPWSSFKAWNNGMCGGIKGTFSSWEVMCVGHEIGHLLGGPHTHDIGIDDCGADALKDKPRAIKGTSKSCGKIRGSLMSYCHLCPGGYSKKNLSNQFHPKVLNGYIFPLYSRKKSSWVAVHQVLHPRHARGFFEPLIYSDDHSRVDQVAKKIVDLFSHNKYEHTTKNYNYGGQCFCPDGSMYQVADQGNNCRSLQCHGGKAGACHKKTGVWSNQKVTCFVPKKEFVCAGQGQTCQCQGEVKYGAWSVWWNRSNGAWSSWKKVNGSVKCDNSVFWDPAWGYTKRCICKPKRRRRTAISNIQNALKDFDSLQEY